MSDYAATSGITNAELCQIRQPQLQLKSNERQPHPAGKSTTGKLGSHWIFIDYYKYPQVKKKGVHPNSEHLTRCISCCQRPLKVRRGIGSLSRYGKR